MLRPALNEGVAALDEQANRQVIQPEGEYWTIIYAGRTCRLRATNGVRYLAYLLGHPNQRVSAGVLEHGAEGVGGGPPVDEAAARAGRERSRVNVTRALTATLTRIEEFHPELGRHLRATLRTGAFCTYTPDPRVPTGWEIGSA
ncbi:MAG: hypothetical protein ACRERC_08225 [Candidatus Binatia bacterium]